MKQLRFKYSVLKGVIPVLFYYIPKAEWIIHHSSKYNDEQCYSMALEIVNFEKRMAKTFTDVYGIQNLPSDGGYIMYSNHQGKYDALGILHSHKEPCRLLWNKSAASRILARQVNKLVRGQTIDLDEKTNPMAQMKLIADEVKSGKKYLIFPEGKYENNRNELQEFQTGCFITSLLSQSPIVPVVVYDSYKAMDINEILLPVRTQVHYLKPIPYEEYKSMNRKAVCQLVKNRIQEKLDELNKAKSA